MPQRHASGRFPSQPRTLAPISRTLDRKLVAYIAAAGATGASLFASSSSAQAKVVYTPANTRLYDNTFPVDLNNDGTADLNLIASFQAESFYRTELHVRPTTGAVVGGAGDAAALTWGTRIGFKAPFSPSTLFMASRAMPSTFGVGKRKSDLMIGASSQTRKTPRARTDRPALPAVSRGN
jgi:hypothetical protein